MSARSTHFHAMQWVKCASVGLFVLVSLIVLEAAQQPLYLSIGIPLVYCAVTLTVLLINWRTLARC